MIHLEKLASIASKLGPWQALSMLMDGSYELHIACITVESLLSLCRVSTSASDRRMAIHLDKQPRDIFLTRRVSL
jgi:hypothetical protein